MADFGYIKLHRKIWDTEILNQERFDRLSAWLWLISHANYKEKSVMIRGNMYKVQRGQMITSIRKLSEIWQWNPRTVMRFLSLLETEKMITRTSTSTATLITVCNYSKYQDFSEPDSEECNTEYNTERNTERNAECTRLIKNKERIKNEKKKTRGGRVIE